MQDSFFYTYLFQKHYAPPMLFHLKGPLSLHQKRKERKRKTKAQLHLLTDTGRLKYVQKVQSLPEIK